MRERGNLHPGIIPACAGSTAVMVNILSDLGDHPRMRGEHRVPKNCSITVLGSSPHARGARAAHLVPAALLGIIPACAGST